MDRPLRRMSGFATSAKYAPLLDIPRIDPGQSCPRHYPGAPVVSVSPLGAPLSIREVASLIGCSAWTVRQKYVPQGLPHLRSGPSGKLIFYRDQVVAWILAQQQTKGAKHP